MKKREVLILHEICIVVDLSHGVRAIESKYPVHRTGKNFIRASWEEIEKCGAGFRALMSRVPVEQLGKISEPGLYDADDTETVRRSIYFMPEDSERAICEIKKAVGDRLTEMKKQMDTLHDMWANKIKK